MIKIRSDISESWNPFAVELQRQNKINSTYRESGVEGRIPVSAESIQQSRLDRLTNIEINRICNLPSNLAKTGAETEDELVIKDLLSEIINNVVRQDNENGWRVAIVNRMQSGRQSFSNRIVQESSVNPRPTSPPPQTVRRYFTLRQIEEEIQPHTERLKLEINKRRYRIEIDCANQLGLATPWKRTRYRRPVEEDYGKTRTYVNPVDISLHPDDVPATPIYAYDSKTKLVSPVKWAQKSSYPVVQKSPQRPGYEPLNSPLHEYDARHVIDASHKKEAAKKGKTEGKNPRGRPRKKELSAEKDAKKPRKYKKTETLNASERKKKLVCSKCSKLCDERRFFVQCSSCEQRCHGKCVSLTEKRLKKLGDWFCDDCVEGDVADEAVLYCVCRKPYDEGQFYVGCDGCEDWFHPECVGTTQQDVEGTNAGYLCPTCSANVVPESSAPAPLPVEKTAEQQQRDSRQEFPLLWRLLDVLINNQHSWPFRTAVDPEKLPRYYEIVERPMDLETMRKKLERNEYKNLKSFVADACLIFDNTRQFYVKQNEIYQCADQLEKVFRMEILNVSRDVGGHRSRVSSSGFESHRTRVPSVLEIDSDQLLGFGSDCNMDPTQVLADLL